MQEATLKDYSSSVYNLKNIKFDFISALVVTLVAIPLCLGIALACGVPLFAGIIPGIVGGVLVGALSQSHVSVSGPAAGLITVVIAAIGQLGSFENFLLALLFAGLIQILIGALRLGFIADYIPFNVIQGLLCAIGITIVFKQLPFAFGYVSPDNSVLTLFKESQQTFFIFKPLLHLASNIHLGSVLITFISLVILIYWPKLRVGKFLPAPIIVVIAGVFVNIIYRGIFPDFHLSDPDFLVNIQNIQSLSDIKHIFTFPSFSEWKNSDIYFSAITIAAVASLETLLNLEATEKLDPKKRYCNRNRELFAQGIGNVTCGLLGGLPITSVVIRSSVNIESGARSKFSTIFHGLFLLVSTLILSKWINYIPLASLAAILIYTGYKLSHPKQYISMYKLGYVTFFPFIVTIIAIITTDLLEGTLIGLSTAMLFILKKSSQKGFDIIKEKYPAGTVLHMMLPQQVTFLNKAALIDELRALPPKSQVILDGHFVNYIDYDITEVIKNFITSTASEKGISLNIEGVDNLPNIQNRNDFLTTTTESVQQKLSPQDVLVTLIEGNKRFIQNKLIHRNLSYQVQSTSQKQHPIAVILSCVDSRVPVELVFDVGIGDVFCARIAGNIADDYVLASIEFACRVAGAKVILVLGHTSCGAIRAACDHVEMGHITALVEKIDHAIKLETETHENRNGSNETFLYNVTKLNVEQTRKDLYQNSAILRELIDEGKVLLTSGLYDIKTGHVTLENS